ncbi:MAG: PAS domain-containing protein [Halobacteriales archaeon]
MGMTSNSTNGRSGGTAGAVEELDSEPRVLLFMESGRDRELLSNTLGQDYEIAVTTDVETLQSDFDCCIFDYPELNRVAGTIQERRDASQPNFLPFVLLVNENQVESDHAEAWDYVDDIIVIPTTKDSLRKRIGNLVKRRQTTVELAKNKRALEGTIDDLKLKEQAMDAAPVGITIAEPGSEDDPLVYANRRFQELTGYDSDILGSDCRFLQGDETDEATRAEIREAIDNEEPIAVDILNYRNNGVKFWNSLNIAPLRDDEGAVTNFVGFQTDITERKIRERRLEVMNRVLSHNLHNKMNIIQGHAELLEEEFDDREQSESLETIANAASNLLGLAATVKKVEQTISGVETSEAATSLADALERVRSRFEDRFPNATFELNIPRDDSLEVSVHGLITAIDEAVENAVVHNDADQPFVKLEVSRRGEHWIDIEIEDNGPGMPEHEIEVLEAGETALDHADRLGLWLIYWIVNRSGGSFEVEPAGQRGTVISMSVPSA